MDRRQEEGEVHHGDAVIRYRKANVIHAGDVFFNGMYPFIDGSSGGTLDGLIARADIVRAQRLGVALSFHVNHVRYYGPELRDAILGPERAARLMPIGTAVRLGNMRGRVVRHFMEGVAVEFDRVQSPDALIEFL